MLHVDGAFGYISHDECVHAEKDILNPSEAIDYFVLNRRKFYDLLKNTDGEDFLAYYGERKLILRVAFENICCTIQS